MKTNIQLGNAILDIKRNIAMHTELTMHQLNNNDCEASIEHGMLWAGQLLGAITAHSSDEPKLSCPYLIRASQANKELTKLTYTEIMILACFIQAAFALTDPDERPKLERAMDKFQLGIFADEVLTWVFG